MKTFAHAGLTFDVRDDGPRDGQCVLALHGFPQDSTAWSGVTPTLTDAGLRVLAPDQRGYSPGARPSAREAYRMSALVADVIALLDAADLPRAHLLGHDWGGAVAWAVASRCPDRVATLTVLSTPHPAALAWAMGHSTQGLKSWYVLAMQAPRLPERLFAAALARGGLDRLGLDQERARGYARRMAEPAALTGAINWYRANVNHWYREAFSAAGGGAPTAGPITVPTTYVWGRHDPYLGGAAALRTGKHCTGQYRFIELEAGHWLPEKHAADVASAVLDRVQT